MTGKLQNKLEITCDRKVRKSSNNDRKMSKKKKNKTQGGTTVGHQEEWEYQRK